MTGDSAPEARETVPTGWEEIWRVTTHVVRTLSAAFVDGWNAGTATREEGPVDEDRPQSPEAPLSTLQVKMNMLLSRALEQSTRSGRDELFHRVLDQIVPDEARIIMLSRTGGAWIEHYNTQRRHSALGGLPPVSRLPTC